MNDTIDRAQSQPRVAPGPPSRPAAQGPPCDREAVLAAARETRSALGLRPPEQDRPPPAREVLRLAEQEEGWGVPARDWVRPPMLPLVGPVVGPACSVRHAGPLRSSTPRHRSRLVPHRASRHIRLAAGVC